MALRFEFILLLTFFYLLSYNYHMFAGKKISLIIPCYNEEEGLKKLLPQVPHFIDEVLVVDNNSKDQSSKVARELGAKVTTEKKQGYGATYLKGFKEASGDIFVTMDGDATYPLDEIKRILQEKEKNQWQFVSCSRFPLKDRRSMHWKNVLGNKVLTLMTNIIFGLNLKDSQSGMWVFDKDILSKIKLESLGMPLSEELKIECFKNPQIKSAETKIPYYARVGKVKLRMFSDGWKNLVFLLHKKKTLKTRL